MDNPTCEHPHYDIVWIDEKLTCLSCDTEFIPKPQEPFWKKSTKSNLTYTTKDGDMIGPKQSMGLSEDNFCTYEELCQKPKFDQWIKTHGCSERELWLLQNAIGSIFGWDHPEYLAALKAWEFGHGEPDEPCQKPTSSYGDRLRSYAASMGDDMVVAYFNREQWETIKESAFLRSEFDAHRKEEREFREAIVSYLEYGLNNIGTLECIEKVARLRDKFLP